MPALLTQENKTSPPPRMHTSKLSASNPHLNHKSACPYACFSQFQVCIQKCVMFIERQTVTPAIICLSVLQHTFPVCPRSTRTVSNWTWAGGICLPAPVLSTAGVQEHWCAEHRLPMEDASKRQHVMPQMNETSLATPTLL